MEGERGRGSVMEMSWRLEACMERERAGWRGRRPWKVGGHRKETSNPWAACQTSPVPHPLPCSFLPVSPRQDSSFHQWHCSQPKVSLGFLGVVFPRGLSPFPFPRCQDWIPLYHDVSSSETIPRQGAHEMRPMACPWANPQPGLFYHGIPHLPFKAVKT